MKGKILEDIFERFSEENVRFCVLRNYEYLENEKDVDLIISRKDHGKVRGIMEDFGLKKGIDFGHYLSYKNKIVWFDFRVGGIVYQGFLFKNFDKVFKARRKFKNFYVISKEEELVHLVLHSIVDKGAYRPSYVERIEKLMGEVDGETLKGIFSSRLGSVGNKIYSLVRAKDYESSLKLRGKILWKLFRFRDLPNFILLKAIKILR